MKRMLTILAVTLLIPVQFLAAHCEVPCGIYADQLRFEQMLEDQTTIAKAVTSMTEIAESLASEPTVQDINQIGRWTTTKEAHATNTQHIIAQYFMTQRIKPTADDYTKKLTAAHAVMVAAMKCKQTANDATADALRKAILDFYRAYEGKEPNFHSE